MKNGLNKKVKDDYKRLQKYSDSRALLIYKFGRSPINLEAKINEFTEFKSLTKTVPGNITVNVVGDDKPYYFEAVLLSW